MLNVEEQSIARDRARRAYIVAVGKALKETLLAGIQAAGGTALAVYTYKNSESPVWPVTYSVVAVGGTYNVFKSVLKIFRISVGDERDKSFSASNVINGAIVYSASLYGFSEAWKCNSRLWMSCLGTAVFGLRFGHSSIKNLKRSATSKTFKLGYGPALIVWGTVYLYFRKHEEEYLYWIPVIVTGAIGLKYGSRGCTTEAEEKSKEMLMKTIEVFMGGCLLTTSSTVLAIYFSINEFHPSCVVFMTLASFVGVFYLLGSIVCLHQYVGMSEEAAGCLGAMATGNLMFISACLIVKYMDRNIMVYCTCVLLAGGGHGVFWSALYDLYYYVPRPVFDMYSKRTLGPLVTIYSSIASAYISKHMGWRFALPLMPFAPAGIYATYKGFRKSVTA